MKTSTKNLTIALCLALLTAGSLPAQARTACSPKARAAANYITASEGCNLKKNTSEKPEDNAPAAVNSASMANEVIRQVNAERQKAGLSELRVDSELTRAACVRAAEIVQKFSHTRPDGSAWSTVSSRAYGENIAMGQRTADKVMAAWMSSSGHRANILRPSFGSIGVCAYTAGGVTYWVQLFGK